MQSHAARQERESNLRTMHTRDLSDSSGDAEWHVPSTTGSGRSESPAVIGRDFGVISASDNSNTSGSAVVSPTREERPAGPVSGQGAGILNHLVVERDAGRGAGTTDLLWINGETFANLRAERLLDGPWAGRLPNAAYVDSASPIVARDFEQDPEGYESPWGRVQLALIYDTARTPDPPGPPGLVTMAPPYPGCVTGTVLSILISARWTVWLASGVFERQSMGTWSLAHLNLLL